MCHPVFANVWLLPRLKPISSPVAASTSSARMAIINCSITGKGH